MSPAQELIYNKLIAIIKNETGDTVIRSYQAQTIPSRCIVVKMNDLGAIGNQSDTGTRIHRMSFSINCHGDSSAHNATIIASIPQRFTIDGATMTTTSAVKDLTGLEQGAYTSRHMIELFGRYTESLTIQQEYAEGVEGVQIEH